MSTLIQRFDGVCERLARSVARSGRQADSVQLVAVSKWHEADAVAELAAYWAGKGTPVFGESYAQEAAAKMPGVASRVPGCPVHWHFIGHLQSKKAKDVAGRFDLIHSVDSLKLAQNLQKAAQPHSAGISTELCKKEMPAAPGSQPILVQVNIGREPQKSGVLPEELEALITSIMLLPELCLQGLMCLPPNVESPEESRPFFQELRTLRDTMERTCGLKLPHLSMGMSSDFEAAVEEGATLVRIGTDIFGPRL